MKAKKRIRNPDAKRWNLDGTRRSEFYEPVKRAAPLGQSRLDFDPDGTFWLMPRGDRWLAHLAGEQAQETMTTDADQYKALWRAARYAQGKKDERRAELEAVEQEIRCLRAHGEEVDEGRLADARMEDSKRRAKARFGQVQKILEEHERKAVQFDVDGGRGLDVALLMEPPPPHTRSARRASSPYLDMDDPAQAGDAA